MLAIITRVQTAIEGRTFPAGATIATIETDVPLDRLQSLFSAGVLLIDEQIGPIGPISPIGPIPKTIELPTDPPPPIESDPLATPEPTPEQYAEINFPGLKPRIAIALAAADLIDDEQLREYIAAGKDVTDIEGIGRTAKAEIETWLKTTG